MDWRLGDVTEIEILERAEEIKRSKKTNKKGRFMKGTVLGIFIFLLIFTICNEIIFYFTGNEPSTLITCVFAFCSIEGGITGALKIFKK